MSKISAVIETAGKLTRLADKSRKRRFWQKNPALSEEQYAKMCPWSLYFTWMFNAPADKLQTGEQIQKNYLKNVKMRASFSFVR